jgi:hypothetical protein
MLKSFFGLALLLLPLGLQAQENWGSFSGPLLVQLLDNGRDIQLLADFSYTDPDGSVWLAPKGLVSDGASIPKAFWSFIGGPLDDKYRDASVIHDEGCDTHARTWQDTEMAFYNAMRCGGVDEIKAKIMYYAVYHFGPHWGTGTAASNLLSSKHPYSVETTSNLLDTTTSQQAGLKASDAVEWIKTQNPSLEQIQEADPSSPTGDQTQ